MIVDIDAYTDSCLKWYSQEKEDTRDAFSMPDVVPASILGSGRGTEQDVRLAENLMLKYPDLDMPYYWLSHHYALKRDFKRARDILNQGLEQSKLKRYLCDEYGWLECEAGLFLEAVKWWLRGAIIQLNSGRPSCYGTFMYLGYTALFCNNKPLSEKLFSITDSIRSIRLNEVGQRDLIETFRAATPGLIECALHLFATQHFEAK